MSLEIWKVDTKPIVCSVGVALDEHLFTLTATHATLPDEIVTIEGEITDSENGTFQFPRNAETFEEGTYSATISIQHPTGNETSDPFYINVGVA